MKRILAVAAVYCFLWGGAAPAHAAEVVKKPFFTVTLPDGWVEVPHDVIEAMNEGFAAKMPNAKIKFAYGFQPKPAKDGWLEYPYILVQQNTDKRLAESTLKAMPKVDMDEVGRRVSKELPDDVSVEKFDSMEYDEAAHTVWLTARMEVEGLGKVRNVTGMIVTETGDVRFCAYATEATYQTYLPVFRQIITSTVIPPDLVYKTQPTLGEWVKGKLGKDEVKVAITVVAGFVFLFALGAALILWRTRRRE